MHEPVMQTTLGGLPVHRGKVRDIYDLGDRLLLVATDRISAFDCILPTGIPDKGRVLTQISAFWFGRLNEPHHMLSTDLAAVELPPGTDPAAVDRPQHAGPQDRGRADRMRRARLPVGLGLEGVSAASGSVCGIRCRPDSPRATR